LFAHPVAYGFADTVAEHILCVRHDAVRRFLNLLARRLVAQRIRQRLLNMRFEQADI
jgi:hypothetical protein